MSAISPNPSPVRDLSAEVDSTRKSFEKTSEETKAVSEVAAQVLAAEAQEQPAQPVEQKNGCQIL